MAIIKNSSFALVLTALLSPIVMGNNINFDTCKRQIDQRNRDNNNDGQDQSFDSNRSGSQRRTYGNLCTGSRQYNPTGTTDDQQGVGNIDSRNQDPFRRFCDLIDRFPNVFDLMAKGNAPHTVFAPTDAAFSKIDGLLGRLDDQRVLELHILGQARLTQDLKCGQTYRTLNTQQDRRSRQRSKTRCISAGRSQQIGPGNSKNGLNPVIGQPNNLFNAEQFESQERFVLNFNNDNDDNNKRTFSQDVISCNGVIHVVNEVLLPGPQGFSNSGRSYYGGGGGYGSKASNYPSYYGSKGSSGRYYGGSGKGIGNGNSYYSRGGSAYYGKSSKKSKGYKGTKGYKGAGVYNSGYGNQRSGNYGSSYGASYYGSSQGYYRMLEADMTDEVDLDADERYMSDAEFFGIEGLMEDPAEFESVIEQENEADHENRKLRLEAMLEYDGKITEV